MNRKSIKQALTAAIMFLTCLITTVPIFSGQYQYRTIVSGDVFETIIIKTEVADSGTYIVTQEDKITGYTHHVTLNSDYHSTQWVVTDKAGDNITFSRNGSTIVVNGTRSDERINKKIEIDTLPWFASLDFGIQGFCLSGKKTIDFWVIDPDNYKSHRMTLTRMETETVSHAGNKTRSVRIRITASGVPALFFSMNYWVRIADGVPVRSETKRGGPLSPTVINELVRVSEK
ncbi:MAG: hypothetical protein PF637_09400 [Spirochaetes bacterium]|jgi:hypothetical protein|nr:hypothetical protein [Spirochaetota bacterium]